MRASHIALIATVLAIPSFGYAQQDNEPVGGMLGPDGLSKNWIVNFIPDHIAGASYYASFSLGRLFKLRHSPRAASSASDMSLSLFPRDVRPRRLAAPNESPVSALARWPDTPMLAQAESAFRRFSRLRSDF